MKRLLLLVALAAMTLAADSRYHEDFHYSFPQGAGGRLSVDNFNGSVEITGWDQNSVDISGTKYADSESRLRDIRIDASHSGNAVTVRTIHPEFDHHGNMGAKYVIRVPRQTELDHVRSSNGGLRVDTVDGNVTIETSNGSVHIGDIHGNVDAHTSNGSLDIRRVDGRMTFHTSNGSVRAENIRGGVHATTSNGSVDLEFDSAQTQANDVVASTSNGGITVRLPALTNATVSAHTSGHDRIYSDFDVTVHGSLAKYRLEGNIGNGGGPRIDLSTSNGNIKLLKS